MAWTPQLEEQAKAEGWGMATVIDADTSRVYDMVVSRGGFPNDRAAGQHVLNQARSNSKLHITAMRELMASRVASKRRRGGKS
jgi:hypothetical protein